MKLLLLVIILANIQKAFLAPEKQLLCTHLYNKVAHITIEQPDPEAILDLDTDDDEEQTNKNVQQDNKSNVDSPIIFSSSGNDGINYEKCSSSNFCYALWQVEPGANGTNNIVIMGQGCWAGSNGKQDCERSECISDKKPPKAANNTKFCCCSGRLCNSNFTDAYIPSEDDAQDPKILPPASEFLEQTRREHQRLVMFVTVGFVLLILTIILIIMYSVWHIGWISPSGSSSGKNQLDTVHLMENGGPRYANGIYNVDHLKLIGRVGQGRYGSVWKGTVNEQDVAVKIFPSHYRNYFYNERDIYCLPFMDNPVLLTYFGYDERTNMEGHIEYLLVLSYAPNGCLQDYLKEHVLDWNTFCKMALSVAKGLAHLHTDVTKGDQVKPCVSHRDLNSRNVLVKNDLSCCLCDLGFAMKISSPKYFQTGNGDETQQTQETKSLSEVGTIRYMAPEVLEGAVNLLDCESSLKQIDVYALGLVLWELASRCGDLYPPGVEMPTYKLPFENEVGLHPTFEQMQTVVSRHKARPLWPPEAWNGRWGNSAAHRLVRETTEDCWDQDAEARLTALCVEERLSELSHIKDRGGGNHRVTIYSSAVVSPTQIINSSSIINNNHINTIAPPNMTYNQDSTTGGSSHPSTGKDTSEISEGTVETVYTMTPSEPLGEQGYKNSNQTAQYIQQQNQIGQSQIPVLQPFQGRNPCMERNLLIASGSAEDIQCPNTLIDKSFKHLSSYYRPNSETQALIGNDYLNQNGNLNSNSNLQNGVGPINRPATPIPYVQNVVYDSNSTPPAYTTIPKTQNISGSSPGLNETSQQPSSSSGGGKYGIFGWSGWRRLLDKKLFSRETNNSTVVEEPEVKSNLLTKDDLHPQIRRMQSNPIVMDTQVNLMVRNKMVNGFTKQNSAGDTFVTSILNETSQSPPLLERSDSLKCNKRPSTLQLAKCDNKLSSKIYNESNPISNQKFTTVPPIKQIISDIDNVIETDSENAQLLSSPETTDSSKSMKPKITSSGISQVIKRRKSLCRESSLEQFNEVFSSNIDLSRLKDPNERIKTPGDVPPSVRRNRGRANSNNSARFSLYDDRMMSVNKYEDDSDVPSSWSNSVPDGIGISINNQSSCKSKIVENLVVANRTDSVSSF